MNRHHSHLSSVFFFKMISDGNIRMIQDWQKIMKIYRFLNANVDPIWRGVMHHKFILVQFFCLSKSRTMPISLTWLTPISRCLEFESRSWACVCLAAGGFYTKLLKLKYSLITNRRKCADALYFTKEWIVDFKTRTSTWPKS